MEDIEVKTYSLSKLRKVYENMGTEKILYLKYKNKKFLINIFKFNNLNINFYDKDHNNVIKLRSENDKTLFLDSFFFGIDKKYTKLNSSFFIEMIEDIAKVLGFNYISLYDASYVSTCSKVSLREYYLLKYGYSYYEKYGFRYKYNENWKKLKKNYSKVTIKDMLDSVPANKLIKLSNIIYKYGNNDTKISKVLTNKINCDNLKLIVEYSFDSLLYLTGIEDGETNLMIKKIKK